MGDVRQTSPYAKTVSLTERIRADHSQVPLMTVLFSGKDSAELDTKLEAFAHQVRTFAAAKQAKEPKRWFESLWR